jgi:hypothetical protein
VDTPDEITPSVGRRELLRLGLAAALLVASVAGMIDLGAFVAERWTQDFPLNVPYGGWQVDVSEGLLAALLLVVACLAARTVVRGWQTVRPLAPYRLAVPLLAVLPGLLLGAGAGSAAKASVGWASDHTSAAEAERVATRAMLAANRIAPPVTPSYEPPAPAALAARLLRVTDLGSGWYDLSRPEAIDTKGPGLSPPAGQLSWARSGLQRAHRHGEYWVADAFLVQTVHHFATSAQARDYLVRGWPRAEGSWNRPVTTWTERTVRGVVLLQTGATGNQPPTRTLAGFVVGTDVVVLHYSTYKTRSTTNGSVTVATAGGTNELLRLARLALHHATAA